MKNTQQKRLINACIIGGIATLISYFVSSIFSNLFYQAVMNFSSSDLVPVWATMLFGALRSFLGVLLATILYYLVRKDKFPATMALVASTLAAIAIALIMLLIRIIGGIYGLFASIIYLVIYFVVYALSSMLLPVIASNNYSNVKFSNEENKDYSFNADVGGKNILSLENIDDLSTAILSAIKSSLKSPMSAVLCSSNEFRITEGNGFYTIEGYVNSQNSYGAMIATDFSVTATYNNGKWNILSNKIGVKNAKNYAKNFTANYIAITIICAVMGLLLYFVIQLVVG